MPTCDTVQVQAPDPPDNTEVINIPFVDATSPTPNTVEVVVGVENPATESDIERSPEIQVAVDGTPVGTQSITLPPANSGDITFTLDVQNTGTREICASVVG
jgi:hypothetical protein